MGGEGGCEHCDNVASSDVPAYPPGVLSDDEGGLEDGVKARRRIGHEGGGRPCRLSWLTT